MEKDEKLEPDNWDFHKEGLYTQWYESKPIIRNEIDTAMKKVLGDTWDKPLYPKRREFFR